jgi:hypothetical protein
VLLLAPFTLPTNPRANLWVVIRVIYPVICHLVAEENRREFVELYVSFWLNRSIHSQFEAFAKGFLMLCGGPALQVGGRGGGPGAEGG